MWFRVRPVSKTKEDKNNNKSVYWTCSWTDFEGDGVYKPFSTSASLPPEAPGTPSVELVEPNKNTLIAEISGINAAELDATHVEFQIVKNNTSQFGKITSMTINTTYNYVSYTSGKLDPASEYKVRCRSVRGSLKSEWSAYSSSVSTAPSKPAGFIDKTPMAKSSSTDGKVSVYLKWKAVNTATKYMIEYATSESYFDGTDQTTSHVTMVVSEKE